jgi:hypothetical protein
MSCIITSSSHRRMKWERLEYKTPTGLTACVWDAALLAYERQAWVDAVLNNPNGPSIEQYLSAHG